MITAKTASVVSSAITVAMTVAAHVGSFVVSPFLVALYVCLNIHVSFLAIQVKNLHRYFCKILSTLKGSPTIFVVAPLKPIAESIITIPTPRIIITPISSVAMEKNCRKANHTKYNILPPATRYAS